MPNAARRSIALLFFAGFVAYAYNHAFMVVSPLYVLEIGGTAVDAGAQGSAFIIVAVVLRFLFGPLADRHGAKIVMGAGLAVFAVAGFLMALCDQLWQFMVLRCLQSVGLAAFFPCATALVVLLVPENKTGFWLGAYKAVSSISLLVGPSMAMAFIEICGYRSAFFLMGLCAALAGIASAGIGVKNLENSSACSKRSGRLFGRNNHAKCMRQNGKDVTRILREAVASAPRLMGAVLGTTFIAALGYGLLVSFAAARIEEVLPVVNSGLYFTLVGFGGLVANPLAGWLTDRFSRTTVLAASLFCMGLGIVFLGIPTVEVWTCAVSGFLAGFGYFGSMTTILAIIAGQIANKFRSSALSLQQNGIDLGIACASGMFGLAIGLVGDAGAVFAVQGAVTALLGLAAFLFARLFRSKE